VDWNTGRKQWGKEQQIAVEAVVNGSEEPARMNHTDQIWTNLMRSFRQEFGDEQCPRCYGIGEVYLACHPDPAVGDRWMQCEKCDGTGAKKEGE
jgi:DnaJ-class molecular chaperone